MCGEVAAFKRDSSWRTPPSARHQPGHGARHRRNPVPRRHSHCSLLKGFLVIEEVVNAIIPGGRPRPCRPSARSPGAGPLARGACMAKSTDHNPRLGGGVLSRPALEGLAEQEVEGLDLHVLQIIVTSLLWGQSGPSDQEPTGNSWGDEHRT